MVTVVKKTRQKREYAGMALFSLSLSLSRLLVRARDEELAQKVDRDEGKAGC